MRAYSTNAASEERIRHGIELAIGLGQFPETKPLVTSVEVVNGALEKAMNSRRQAEREQLPIRVKIRCADLNLDQTLRSTYSACEIADGGSRGAICSALFPDGLTPVVASTGSAQHAASTQFVIRAKATKAKGADKVLEEWLPKIEAADAVLATALTERTQLAANRAVAFANEEAAREDHAVAMDKIAGEVRALFPKDRKRWAMIFPSVVTRSPRSARTDNDEAGETDKPEVTDEG